MIKLKYAIVLAALGASLLVFGGREILNIRDVYQYGTEMRARVIERTVDERSFMSGRRHSLEVIERTYVPATDAGPSATGELVTVIFLDGHEPVEGKKREGLLTLFLRNSEFHFWIAIAGIGVMTLGGLAAVFKKPSKPPKQPKKHIGLLRKAA